MSNPPPAFGDSPESSPDLMFDRQVAKLKQLELSGRWLVLGCLWVLVGYWSLRDLWESLGLLSEYCSLTGVIYSFAFHLWSSCGLILCVMLTISTVIRQIKYLQWGLSDKERHQLTVKVQKILKIGSKHPLWRWIQVN